MGCGSSQPLIKQELDPDSPTQLAKETYFSVEEVASLQELYHSLSNSLHNDGLINKDEFYFALFHTDKGNFFADRVFTLFDIKKNNVIEFGEFVRSLSVFHPAAPLEEKAKFAFKIYDLGSTGTIERSEVKSLLGALLKENPDIGLDDAGIENIIDATFAEADLGGSGSITPQEWQLFVAKNPAVISYMTLPVLTQLTTKYPPGGTGQR